MKVLNDFVVSNVVIILLINAKMPAFETNNCLHINISEQDKLHAQLSKYSKVFFFYKSRFPIKEIIYNDWMSIYFSRRSELLDWW